MFEVTIKKEISEQDVIDVLITSLEGGSNYWYYLPDLSMVDNSSTDGIIKSVLDNPEVKIPVHDLDDEETLLGYISKENIQRGLELYLNDNRGEFEGEMDGEESDVFLQYVVMGEIVFG